MNQLVWIIPAPALPALVAHADARAQVRFIEFSAANLCNCNTRKAYARTVAEFLAWCEAHGVASIAAVQPLHVAGYIGELGQARGAPTVKQRLAAVRHLFDWLVVGQVVPVNPAGTVRGPSHIVRRGKTLVLAPEQAQTLLDSIDLSTPVGLRDRALIALMVDSFARIGAALRMRVDDAYTQNRRLWVRLHENGGKQHEMPCHHSLEAYLHAYIAWCGLADTPLPRDSAFQMVRRRAKAAGIATAIGNNSFRATGITAYLKNGGTLEKAAMMANHASTRKTQFYDRRSDEMTLDEVERALI